MDKMRIPYEKALEVCAKSFATIDGAWFIAVEEKYGLEAAIEADLRAWEIFAGRHARRVLNAFGLTGKDVKTVMEAIKLDPINSILKPEIQWIKERRGIIRFTDCSPQKARIRNGRGEFPCKPVGLMWMSKYAEAVNPEIKVRCNVCPPDPHSSDIWCEWEFEMEGGGQDGP